MSKKPCANHERRLRRIEKYMRIALIGVIVFLLRGDNPANLKWILKLVGFIMPEAHANGH